MRQFRSLHLPCLLTLLLLFGPSARSDSPGLPNPFYAMDTCTKRPYPRNDIPPAAQLQMLKDLGYAGIAWTEEPPEQVQSAAAEARKLGLKMFTIYCAASVTPDGDLKHSSRLLEVMAALKGHDTLVWLHIGGKGPAFSALKGDEPVVKNLRDLADTAKANGLRVAVYPHVGEWTARFGDATRLAQVVNHPQFGVTFNLCHCLAMGDEQRIPDLLTAAKEKLFAVTINGADSSVNRPEWSRLIQNLDRGSFDVGGLLRQLRELGYTGPIGLQGYGIGGDRRQNLQASLAAWRKLSAAAAGDAPKNQPPAGFAAIFNGKDLKGWEGSAKYWKVEDGCLTGVADGTLKYNRFIVWRGGPVKNFELRVQVKVSPGGNSGLQYRSTERPDLGESVVVGYQCDVVSNRADYNGMLYEERGRRILAHTGEKVIIDTSGQPWVVGEFPVKEFKAGEWHDFRVLVQGNHHQHWIDGQPTVDVIDLDEKGRKLEGVLGVQVHVGPPMKIQYRDFFLKKLADDLPLISAEQAKIPASARKVVPQGKDRPKKTQ